jgi:hypothetical protein
LGIYPKWMPEQNVLLAAHVRSFIIEGTNMVTNTGIGVYLAKDGAPSNVIGGINFILQDTFETIDTSPFKNRISVNVVAGIKF